jgi:hypothetical protein
MQDRVIGKKVFKVRGAIPAGNFLQIPRNRSRTLGLTGCYVYMQVDSLESDVRILDLRQFLIKTKYNYFV